MSLIRKISAACTILILSGWGICFAQAPLDENIFASPDREYGPMTWWHWINGHVTRDGITKDLTAMHDVGVRGVQMFNTHMYLPEGPVEFASEEWFDLVGHAIRTCADLGMKFTCTTSAGWSGSGGPWIDKERAMKILVYSETDATGGKVALSLNQPRVKDGYYVDELVLAIPEDSPSEQIEFLATKTMVENKLIQQSLTVVPEPETVLQPANVLDLTEHRSGNTLRCTLPQGRWKILRFGYTLTGKKSHPASYGGEGYEVDKFDPKAVEFQWDKLMGKLCERNKPFAGNTFEGILLDSYEASWQNWTAGMFDKFQARFGYDLRPWMPLFTGRYVQSAGQSEQVLHDFRLLCDELLTEGFYGTLQRKAAEYGMVVYAEAQGGPVPASAMDRVDVPMNEFWTPDAFGRYSKIKLTSSQADLHGRMVVAAEAFTSKPENGKWQNTPETMKKPGDLAFAAGINRYCFHTYAMQPLDYIAPGFSLGRYGIMLSRHNTWWDFSPAWMQYITRCQYLLQQGRAVADVGFLFHDDIRYTFASGTTKMPDGFDHIVIYPGQLRGARFEGGRIVLPCGQSVALLAVLNTGLYDEETLSELATLQEAGAAVEFVDPKKTQIGRLLKTARVKPDVVWGITADKKLFYRHMASGQWDAYFLTNQTEEEIVCSPSFRGGKGRQAEIWDAVSGGIRPARVIGTDGAYVQIDLRLGPTESAFVVFRKALPADWRHVQPDDPVTTGKIPVDGTWDVTFTSRDQMPDAVRFKTLSSWSDHPDERIRYYSGTAVYTTNVTIPASILGEGRFRVHLGKVKNIARVEVNGKDCGTVWTRPFALDVTPALKAGKNVLKIYVANTWINRIIGDEQLPEDLTYETGGSKFTVGRLGAFPDWFYSGAQPKNRKRHTFYTWKHYSASDPLTEAGLLGPVYIEQYRL